MNKDMPPGLLDWIAKRPPIIQRVIERLPPNQLYRMKKTGYQCYILAYTESESDEQEDVTLVVQTTGVRGGEHAIPGLAILHTNKVFDVPQTDLEFWEE